jgi:serine protease Do
MKKNLFLFFLPIFPFNSPADISFVELVEKVKGCVAHIEVENGSGSGFLIDYEYVVTNFHVVSDAKKIKVSFPEISDESFDAVFVDGGREIDIAILKLNKTTDFSPCSIGDSEDVKVGEWVLAIGSPMGLKTSVTEGIISAIGRRGSGLPGRIEFFQTSASINPGNSGGPLFNLRGEVIGVTSLKLVDIGIEGIGFVIPVNIAYKIFLRAKTGRFFIGWVKGIEEIREEGGKLVVKKASDIFKEGDVIEGAGERKFTNLNHFYDFLIFSSLVGKKYILNVIRDGRRMKMEAEIVEPVDSAFYRNYPLNICVENTGGSGVRVTHIGLGGMGYLAGIEVGDIIKEIGGKEVRNVKEFEEAVNEFVSSGNEKNVEILVEYSKLIKRKRILCCPDILGGKKSKKLR